MEKEKPQPGEVKAYTKHANIYAALSAFQGDMKPLEKSKKVEYETRTGKMEFWYTPLGDIMKAIYPLLAKHGLSVRHEIVKAEVSPNLYRDAVVAILTHETYTSEQKVVKNSVSTPNDTRSTERIERVTENEIRSGPVMITAGSEMKDTGSALTYARRYSLTMVLGIASEDDMDAQLISESGRNAIQFAYNKAKQGLEGAKTAEAVDKAVAVLKKDLKALEAGKAPALGLDKEQYQDLILYAEQIKTNLAGGTDVAAPEEGAQ